MVTPRSRATALALLILVARAAGEAMAGEPADRTGRYTLQPIDGGVLRLDTETGQMVLCTKDGASVTCEPVSGPRPSDTAVERLADENRELRARIKQLEEKLADAGRAPAPRLELPSEEDVDKALSYMERMLKKFRDKLRDLEDKPGRGT